ncbi:uncharacterized protein LOC129944853 [Eupeodes corollae]|uniref:uncharacterized protein LOC129944853 n=1 Tax=Eupeodes corollae TaxID=290404 RepID=UPI002493968A|nr:uncharacterized protein LOC129944853 [Eupeodes corollae]
MAILVVDVNHHIEQEFMTSLLQKFIPTLRVRKFVIISADNFEKLQDYFIFFKENKFTRIFGIFNRTTYAYMQFADRKIQQVYMEVKLPNSMEDLNGFVFRTTVERNIPRTFWYTTKEGQRKIGGCFGQIFLSFIRRHNATFKEIKLNNYTDMYGPGIINATLHNQIDLSMNIYADSKGLDPSYPVKLGRFLVMVPLNGYVDPNEYFKRPFSLGLWILIGINLIYIVLIDVVIKILTNKPVDIWQSFSQMYLAMIGGSREIPVTTAYRLHIQVFLLSFILMNIYVIWFTSFLTVYIKVKQFETLQDLIDNDVKVMIASYFWKAISVSKILKPGFENLVVTVDYETHLTEMYSMKNTTFAYGLSADLSEFLISLQACFEKPLFHITRDSLLVYNSGFVLAPHSPFKENLNFFIIQVFETGLINKWDYDVVVQARYAGLKELDVHRGNRRTPHKNNDMHVALTVGHLMFCWNLLAIGLTLASLAFVGEILSMIL